MQSRAWDRALGLTFAAIGAGVFAGGSSMPPGMAGVVGPGVFPMGVGALLAALGLALAATAAPGERYWPRTWRDRATRQVAATVALLAVYLLAWDLVPFIWRTPVLLLALYRLYGQPWVRSILLSVVLTATLVIVFQVLFRVRL